MARLGTAAVVVLLTVAACSTGSRSSDTAPSAPVERTSTPLESTATIDAAGAEASITWMRDLADGWNEHALTWVAAYSDPAVGWDEFLTIQHETLVALSNAVAMAELERSQLPSDVQGPASGLVEHYQQRLDAFDTLARAIVAGDVDTEAAAAADYRAISNVTVATPLIRDLLSAPTISSAIESQGATPDDVLEAILGGFPSSFDDPSAG
jgi:hypothetical protein